MKTLEVISIGDDLGIILPGDIVKNLRLEGREFINVIEIPNGIRLVPYPPEVTEQIESIKS